MSAFYRSQLVSSYEDSQPILSNKKSFPVPKRPFGQSDADYYALVRSLLRALSREETAANEILTDLVSHSDKWMALRSNMTGAERTADTEIYDEFIKDIPFPDAIQSLRRYTRILRNQHNELNDLLPGDSTTVPISTAPSIPSHLHLPKMTLPTFSSKCTEYISFWNSFKAGVHDIPSLPDSVKFTYLKQCLCGPALTLVNSLPITDDSYVTAIDLLNDHYANPEEVARSLHQSLRKLPIVRKEHLCDDLRSLIDQMESLCIQFTQQNQTYDTINFQLDIERKLPYFVLEEIYKAKEAEPNWSVDLMKKKLNSILKRKEDLQSIAPKSQRLPIPSNNFKKPTSEFSQPHTDFRPSSLTFHAQKGPKFINRPNFEPKLPCLFCGQHGHFSSACTNYPDRNARFTRLREMKRCFKCMKDDHMANNCPKPNKCSGCSGEHPKALCPSLGPKQAHKPHMNFRENSTHFIQSSPSNTSQPLATQRPHFPSHSQQFVKPTSSFPQYYPFAQVCPDHPKPDTYPKTDRPEPDRTKKND